MQSRVGTPLFCRIIALSYLAILLIMPAGMILWRSLSPGLGKFYSYLSTPAAISALNMTLLLVIVAVPCNTIFGIFTSLMLVRKNFFGKKILESIIDLPFAVSPVIVGVALIALWGEHGILGFVENTLGFKIIFSFPGMVLATLFVTLPFVVREVMPVLEEIGTDMEEAALMLGASRWQVIWKITLPSIRWGVTYGVILTFARTLGEYGSLVMISSNLPGISQTLTLLVSERYERGEEYGSYALATLLMGISIVVLISQAVLQQYRSRKN